MTIAELLVDAFGRIRGVVHQAIGGLTEDQLAFRPGEHANSIGWLVWHLTRIQDDHVADAAGIEQVWIRSGWHDRFALPFAPGATGYGHDTGEVGALAGISAQLLGDYHDAVYDQTIPYLGGLTDAGLDRIVDEGWDPPVSLGVRLVSVVADDLQHAGQAAYVRGLLA